MRPLLSSLRLAAVATALAVAAACSSSSEAPSPAPPAASASPDAAAPADAGASDASDARAALAPPPLPVIPDHGGPIVAAPEIVTVTWSGDPIAADLEAFDDWMVASAFWKDLMAEWGVGPGTHAASYRVPTPAPSTLSESDVADVLSTAIASGAIPPPSPARIYTVYPPSGTTVTNFGSKGCEGFQAYHFSFDHADPDGGAPTRAIYAITPRCADTQGMAPLDYTTWGMSHEVMEAASDPLFDHPAYRIDRQTLATPELGENADLCTGHPTTVDGHVVTRNWSNVAAKAGERPCVPAPPGPMFGAFTDPREITLAPGKSATVDVHLYATGPMAPFRVVAQALDPALTAKLSGTTGGDGDTLTLTVSAAASFVERPGSNLVALYAVAKDYNTRRSLIVHAK